jgi:hypothetical protein
MCKHTRKIEQAKEKSKKQVQAVYIIKPLNNRGKFKTYL